MPGNHLNWDLQLYSSDFTHLLPHEDATGGHAHQAYYQVESHYSDSGLGTSEKAVPVKPGADELLRLQCHLSNLLRDASESVTAQQPALDEVMMACKELLELLPVRRSDCSGPFTPGERSQGDPCHGDQRSPLDPLCINYIAVLQVATSYAYALHLLDLVVDNLKTRAGNLALVSLGIFNLASQPAMRTPVGAYMISNMVHQMRDAISLLMPEHKGLDVSTQRPPPHPSPMGGLQGAATANSIQAAVNMVSEKETSLLEKLAQIMNNP